MRILLVEDDAMLGQSMVASLSRHGYTVDWLQLGNGVELALKTESFMAIILDLTLPDTDGLDVLRRVRRSGHTLPILILTARDDIDDRVKGLDGGADDYLVKPFALEELLARLRVLIRRVAGSTDPVLEIGDLTLSLKNNDVYVQGNPIKLTKNEFKLLATLATQSGRVLSKEALQQALHGWDELASDNAIEVHIHNLRKKVGSKLIKNIRGVGYIIENS
ncbi:MULTISPECIES: response regulator [Photobacterium]|uniref:XRE family transcriptional regulator n=1 Tax=Photobacterium ganghwense TaxID=320778 RepID=A0A0J1K6Q8_9GAMM|nr:MULTISPECIES: response regulator [Photobacterium]KLV10032.1 XRE family transcriptional regulator [Photobacterium ganghwense]MBV1842171.1 response regulator [Photobacterium ganghwense]PSU09110.1 DNA-binding response regulator [Photobacterium ganghwense]QSV16306.1 response regulator [Photobacterium ganghwense]